MEELAGQGMCMGVVFSAMPGFASCCFCPVSLLRIGNGADGKRL